MPRPTRLLTAGLAIVLAAAVVQPLSGALGASPAPEAHAAAEHDHAGHDHGSDAPRCAPSSGGTVVCTHADEPPPGVDVTRLPSTDELQGRGGAAGDAAVSALAAGGDGPVHHAATSGVPCDGDGTSGPRVQAMYVVTADRPNRFAQLQANLQLWAAGVDDVVRRSAAQTGGVRHVRFVTGPAVSGTCTPTVLDVTIPAGQHATFGATMAAVKALGHTDPNRKYLMWADAAELCGVATTYVDDRAAQDNANNGRYPMYARVDAPCWGHPEAVEAHEVVHNLGGVQRSAPNSTPYGHCTDEHDLMCYRDGPGVTMRSVCPVSNATLLDCRNDDYFLAGTPAAGNYLATHWNTADSRFLMTSAGTGGAGTGPGTGTGGGGGATPTGPSVRVTVNGVTGAGPATVCPKVRFPVTAVVHGASGEPSARQRVQFVQVLAGRTKVLKTVVTAADGTASASVATVDGATVSARTVKTRTLASTSSAAVPVSAATCATSIEAALVSETVPLRTKVVAVGRLQRTLGTDTDGLAGARVSLVLTPVGGGTPKVLGSARTDATGAFRLTGTPGASGSVVVRFTATASYGASTSTAMGLTVG